MQSHLFYYLVSNEVSGLLEETTLREAIDCYILQRRPVNNSLTAHEFNISTSRNRLKPSIPQCLRKYLLQQWSNKTTYLFCTLRAETHDHKFYKIFHKFCCFFLIVLVIILCWYAHLNLSGFRFFIVCIYSERISVFSFGYPLVSHVYNSFFNIEKLLQLHCWLDLFYLVFRTDSRNAMLCKMQKLYHLFTYILW